MTFTQFKNKYEKSRVEEISDLDARQPLVSVCIQTYNHAGFIEKCLESILSQKTDFSFEILLGEDQSTDGTREICLKYAHKYKGKIRLFLHQRENNIKINGRPTGRFNWLYNLYSARGKFIALCEGDDYWTDTNKLQKQVKELQMEEEVVACFTNAHIEQENGLNNYAETYCKGTSGDRYYNFDEIALKGGGLFPTASFLFKNQFEQFPQFLMERQSGDRALSLLLASQGKFKYLDQLTCVYRVHSGGLFSGGMNDSLKRVRIFKDNIKLLKSFDQYSQKRFHSAISKAISLQAKKALLAGKVEKNFILFRELTLKDSLSFCKNIFS